MYNNKFVIAVKHNGEVLKEFKDSVYIPFGSEYSVFLKNLNTVRATAKIWIDGDLVTEDVDLVVPPNGSVDLERFIKNGNANLGNRFKFIERNAAVESHRGIGGEDGLLRVEFKFEKPAERYTWGPTYKYDMLREHTLGERVYTKGVTVDASHSEIKDYTTTTCSATTFDSFSLPVSDRMERAVNDVGITAQGSVSNQAFTMTSWFPTENESFSMVLKLLGKTRDSPVDMPILVSTKPQCVSCGRKNKSSSKFCSSCGTSLIIV